MNPNYIAVFFIFFFIAGCTTTSVSTPKDFDTTYHVVDFRQGDVLITSAFQSDSISSFRQGTNKESDLIRLHTFDKNWGRIQFNVHSENIHCLKNYNDLETNLEGVFYTNILTENSADVTINLVPQKNFRVTERFSPGDSYRFYYPVDLCNPSEFPIQALQLAGKVAHELYHILVFKSFDADMGSVEEEEKAYMLQFCNGVLSEHQADFEKNYFNLDFAVERKNAIDNSASRTERDSRLGRLNAMEKVRSHLASDASDKKYCQQQVAVILADITT